MKKLKRIIGSVAFLLCVVLILTPISYALRTNSINRDMLTPFYAEDKNTIDVVYLGSSAVYRYYIPPMQYKSYGYTSFNFATAGQPMDAVVHDIVEVEKRQDPDLYVIELRMLLVEQNYALTGTDNKWSSHEMHYNDIINGMRYSLNRAALTQKLFGFDISWQLDIIRNHVNWKDLTLYDIKDQIFPPKDETKGVMTRATVEPQADTSVTKSDMTVELTEKGQRQLKEICDKIESLGKDALFVVSPFIELPNKREQQMRMMAVSDAAEKYVTGRGYKYINMCYKFDEIGLDTQKDFYNHRHVNVLGAQKVTDYIGSFIASNYKLSKDYSPATVSEWDKAFELWAAEKGKQEQELEEQNG
jgi:hypothetical protein